MKDFIKKITFLLFIITSLFVLQINAQTVKLKIIETTDTHGAVYPFDFKDNHPVDHSLAQIYTYVEQQRADSSQKVILLSGGDLLQGTPVVYYYNFEKPNSKHIYAEMMNFMKYDAATVGNHDIETGHAVYDKFNKELNFPWLAANDINTATGKPYFKPYTVIHRAGLKIAVFGMITPGIPDWLPQKIWSGMKFEDMIKTAEKWVPIIKEKVHPDLLVGLFHSGVDYTYGGENANTPNNENASLLVAEKVPGFDIVFVGHDHHGWNEFVTNPNGKKILLMGGTHAALVFAAATVTMTYNKTTHKWDKKFQGKLVESKNYKPDSLFMKKFKEGFIEVKKYVSKPIGYFTKTISTRASMFGDSPFIDFIQNIQLKLTGADVSFASPLSFDAEIKKGEISVGNMFNLYRFENFLYTMKLSGKEIKGMLEFSYAKWFNQMKNENDHLLNFVKDENGKIEFSKFGHTPILSGRFYNFMSAAGINYAVDVSKPAGHRVTIFSMSNGAPFDSTKEYTAAINSYRGNGGGGHLIRGAKIPKSQLASHVINSTVKDLRFYIMKWIEKKGKVTPKAFGNWKVIPSKWAEKGRAKDYKLLYGNKQ